MGTFRSTFSTLLIAAVALVVATSVAGAAPAQRPVAAGARLS